MAGEVSVDGVMVDKPGHPVSPESALSLKDPGPYYVSRGGIKLEAALSGFSVDVEDKVVMDVGASTGGFTDCLLQRGARRVIAVDVGYGQFHWKLRGDPRVRLLEKTNIRYLSPGDLGEPVDGAVIDVSFISLRLVLPPVSRLLRDEAFVVALIKPQFEVGRTQVGKGGVVRDPLLHEAVVEELTAFFNETGWTAVGNMASPILGPKGNREFLSCLRRRAYLDTRK